MLCQDLDETVHCSNRRLVVFEKLMRKPYLQILGAVRNVGRVRPKQSSKQHSVTGDNFACGFFYGNELD